VSDGNTQLHANLLIPILGTGRLERLAHLCGAEQVVIDRQDWFAIWEASAGGPVP
jgi:predicted oxidoreductase